MIRVLVIFIFLGVLSLSNLRGNSTIFVLDYPRIDTLKNDTLGLDTISIIKHLTAEDKFNQKKNNYKATYTWGNNKNIFSNGNCGVLLSINKLYSHFSRIRNRTRRLKRVFENEYEQDKVEAMWMPLTVKYTGLKEDSLFYFQMYFLPKSSFLEEATFYEKVEYVVKSLRLYRDSTAIIHQRMKLPSNYIDSLVNK